MELEVVATGLRFPEGPVAMPDGSVILVEIQRQTLSRVTPDARIEVIAELGGGPNGAAIGPDSAIYVANNGGFGWVEEDGITSPHGTPDWYAGGSIQRVDPASGAVATLYTECDGRALRGPNDLVFDAHGGFWFSDLGKADDERLDHGRLLYATADGRSIRQVLGGMTSPNGVGLSPDGRTLYVAETRTSRVQVLEIVAPGVVRAPASRWTPRPVLGPLPGYQLLDSLAVEAGGKVCVGTLVNGGVSVFDPAGGVEHVPVPDPMVTNLCFGGEDMRDAWITASGTGTLYRCRWPRPGLRLNYQQI